MEDMYKDTFDKIKADEQKKAEYVSKTLEHKNTLLAGGKTKPKRRFTQSVWKIAVAASTAAVMLFCAIFIPLMYHSNQPGGSKFASLSLFADTLNGYSDAFKPTQEAQKSFFSAVNEEKPGLMADQNWVDSLNNFNFLLDFELTYDGGSSKEFLIVDKNICYSLFTYDSGVTGEWYTTYDGGSSGTCVRRFTSENGIVGNWEAEAVDYGTNECVYMADFLRTFFTAEYNKTEQNDKDVYTAKDLSQILLVIGAPTIDPVEVIAATIEISKDNGKDSLLLLTTYGFADHEREDYAKYIHQLTMKIVLGGQKLIVPAVV